MDGETAAIEVKDQKGEDRRKAAAEVQRRHEQSWLVP